MLRCSRGEASTVAPLGMGSRSDSWPMSCMRAAYSSSSSSDSDIPSSRPIPWASRLTRWECPVST